MVLCKSLIDEEAPKSRELELEVETGNVPPQRRKYRLRDEKIAQLSERLKKGDITVDDFLNQIVVEENNVCLNKCEFDINLESDSDSDFESYSQELPSTSQPAVGVVSGKRCVICLDAVSDVLLGCGHYNYCMPCFETQQSVHRQRKIAFDLGRLDTEPILQCPLCKVPITNHMQVKKIFVD